MATNTINLIKIELQVDWVEEIQPTDNPHKNK